MQNGQIFKNNAGTKWFLRYYTGKRTASGARERKMIEVCAVSDEYRTEAQVENHPKVAELLRPASNAAAEPGTLMFVDYVEREYLPDVEAKMTASTYKGYRNLFGNKPGRGIRPLVEGIPLADFSKASVTQNLLDKLAARGTLSTRTLIHVKAFVSGVISEAIRRDKMPGVLYNPLHHSVVKIEGGNASEDTHAYTLNEVEDILDVCKDNQLHRTLIAVAMYAGLRRSEIRGLQWGDLDFDPKTKQGTLSISRTFWGDSSGETKTEDSSAEIPLIPQLWKQLEAYRKQRVGLDLPDRFIFEGPRPNMPYDISAIGNKMIKPILLEAELEDENGGGLWHGFHGFRRGLGNTLDGLGVDMKVIAGILRHKTPITKSIVTEKHYTKTAKMPRMVDAMRRLSAEIDRVRYERKKHQRGRKSA
jgi:integrase